MINKKLLFIVASAAAAIVIITIVAFFIYRPAPQTPTAITYTDPVSSETYTAFPKQGDLVESDEALKPLPNEISITGLEDFFSTIDQDKADSILTDLTTFIRARVGTRPTTAGVVDSKVQLTSENPTTYTFTMVLQYPESAYSVTITIPDTATAPVVTFGDQAS